MTTTKAAAKKAPAAKPAHEYSIGDKVDVAANGRWYPGKVVELAKTNVTVRYVKGSGQEYDLSVNPNSPWKSAGEMGELPSRIRPAATPGTEAPAAPTPPPAQATAAKAPARPAKAPAADDPRVYAGAVVKSSREAAGVTKKDLAERMHTSTGAIDRLEGGRTNPTMTTLANVAQALDAKLTIAFTR